jgi:hypothetical protein
MPSSQWQGCCPSRNADTLIRKRSQVQVLVPPPRSEPFSPRNTGLMGHLHVGSAGGDEQRGAYVTQLMGGVANGSIGVGSGIAVGELEVPAPHGITEEAAPLSI